MSSFVTVQHPQLGEARVPASAVKHMEPKGWVLAPDPASADPTLVAQPDVAATAPPKSASKAEWVDYATRLGVPDPDQFTRDELVDRLTPNTEE